MTNAFTIVTRTCTEHGPITADNALCPGCARAELAEIIRERDEARAAAQREWNSHQFTIADAARLQSEVATAREEGRRLACEEAAQVLAEVEPSSVPGEHWFRGERMSSGFTLEAVAHAIRSLSTTPAPEPAAPTPGEGKP